MDRNREYQLWQRVYAQGIKPLPMTTQQRRQLQNCLQRSEMNLRIYEGKTNEPVYGDAFRRLAIETAEHCKMLRQILGRP